MRSLQLPDEELVLVVLKDNERYRELMERYEVELLAYCSYLVKNPIVATEVLQEAFIAAYKNLKSFSPKTKFATWIYRVTHDEIVKSLKAKNHKHILEAEGFEEEFEQVGNFEENALSADLVSKVRKNNGKVPFKYRDPLVLHFLLRKSITEISDIIRVSPQIVEERIAKAEQIIKK